MTGIGKMGHEIESIAVKRGHVIKLIIDLNNKADLNKSGLKGIDVAIEFSTPAAALANVIKCLENKVPVVSGTTGWLDQYDKAVEVCRANKTSFIHSTNFSIGVNLFFRLNQELAKQIERYHNYQVSIEEIHHTQKLDAPSGTAISLANGISGNNSDYNGWCFDSQKIEGKIPIKSIREGVVPGTHVVTWDSDIDTLTLRHEAKNRKGLALGAVVAAEFIHHKTGIYTMNEVMGF